MPPLVDPKKQMMSVAPNMSVKPKAVAPQNVGVINAPMSYANMTYKPRPVLAPAVSQASAPVAQTSQQAIQASQVASTPQVQSEQSFSQIPVQNQAATQTQEMASLTAPRPVFSPQSELPQDLFQPMKTRSLEEIRAEQLKQAQALIDATQQVYLDELSRLKDEGKARLGQTSSMAVGAGLAGSPFMQAQENKTQDYNNRIVGAKEAERRAEIASIMSAAFQRSTEQYDRERSRALQERQQYTSELDRYQDDIKSRQEANKTAAISSIKNIAAGGLSLSDLDQNQYQDLLSKSGLSDFEAKAIFNSNTPQAQGKTEVQGDQLVTYYVDPKTGKPTFSATKLPDSVLASKPADLQVITTDEGVFVFDKSKPKLDAQGNYIMQRVGAAPKKSGEDQQKIVKIGGIDYVQNPDGTFSLPQLPPQVNTQAVERAQEAKAIVDEIVGNEDLNDEFGFAMGKSFLSGTDRQVLESKVERLKALLTTENLQLMKGLGAMSEKEFDNLKAIGTSLNIDLPESEAIKELKRIQETLQKTISTGGTGVPTTAGLPEADIQSFMTEKGVDRATAEASLKAAQQQGLYKPSFNNPLSMGQKGSANVSGIKDFTKVATIMGTGVATGIERGSSAWQYGLDLVLDGGKGAPVKTPFGGEIIFASNDGGFGKSVKVRLDNGEIIRLSHLDKIGVKPGQRIPAGTVIGTQGNSGKVIKVNGGTGTHVDVTMYKPNGKPYTSKEVASFLNTQKLS